MRSQGDFPSEDQFEGSELVKMFADPGSNVDTYLGFNTSGGYAIFDGTIAGYLVDVP
jgi:hypothetical protein